jgi:hypothetical protein
MKGIEVEININIETMKNIKEIMINIKEMMKNIKEMMKNINIE